MNRFLWVTVACSGLAYSTPAWAGDHARLAVTREASAADCPGEQVLRNAVGARLGYEPFDAGASSELTVVFRRQGTTLHAVIVLKDETGNVKGERTISSRRGDCDEVAAATTLTISILLDPRSGLAKEPESAPPPAREPSAPVPAASSTPPNFPARAAGPSLLPPRAISVPHETELAPPAGPINLVLSADLTSSLGNSPGPSFGFLFGAGVEHRLWSASAELRLDLPADSLGIEIDDLSDTAGLHRARTHFTALNLVPCARFGLGYACGVVALGLLRSETLRQGSPQAKSAYFHALIGPRVGLGIPLSRSVSLAAHLEASYALTESTLRAADTDVWTTPSVLAQLGIGLRVQIP